MRCYCCDRIIKGDSQEVYDRDTGRYYLKDCWDIIQTTIKSFEKKDKKHKEDEEFKEAWKWGKDLDQFLDFINKKETI